MCLIVPKEQKPVTSTEDKKVYKVMSRYRDAYGNFRSAIMSHSYTPDKLESAEITESTKDWDYTCFSYHDRHQVETTYPDFVGGQAHPDLKAIVKGIHYSLTFEGAVKAKNYDQIVVQCLIPAGSEVIEAWGLGVTNQLIVVKQV